MNKDDIKKALECCANYCPTDECPYGDLYGCDRAMMKDALALITEQENEIERLKSENEKLKTKCDDLKKLSDWQREEIKILKAEVNKGCDNCETIKQGQVDVLKKLRSRVSDKEALIQSYIADGCLTIEDMYTEIDELIKEVENEN